MCSSDLQVINVISVRGHESGMELVVSGVENFDHQVELKTLAISNSHDYGMN